MRRIAFRTVLIGVGLALACVAALNGPAACSSGMTPVACIGSAVGNLGPLSGLAAVALAILATALALGVLWQVRRHEQLAGALARAATPTRWMNHDVAIVASLSAPCVAGLVRPRIYCPGDLGERLTQPELRAVLLHERHHQLSHAPARLVALAAIATILDRSGTGGRWVERRRGAIEVAADRYAVRAGARPPEIARALLKLAPSFAVGSLPGYLGATDVRLRHLLGEVEPDRGRQAGLAAFVLPAGAFLACLVAALMA